MKKILSLVAVAGTLSFLACGPSAEELEKIKKHREDSAQRVADSIKAIEDAKAQRIADSLKVVEENAKRIADSTRVADSLAALKKGGPKKPPVKKDPPKAPEGAPKVGSGKPGAK